MIKKLPFKYNNMDIYIDPYTKSNNVLRGRKQNSDAQFLIVSEEYAGILTQNNREKILEDILNKD
jgi:hypothetical protein